MSAYLLFLGIITGLFLLVVSFAISKRPNVRASLNLKWIGFSLETKDNIANDSKDLPDRQVQ
jgi:hypothetical protein